MRSGAARKAITLFDAFERRAGRTVEAAEEAVGGWFARHRLALVIGALWGLGVGFGLGAFIFMN